MGTKRRYSEEFKQEAVRLIQEEGVSVRHVAADLDVSEWTIRGWIRKAGPPAVRRSEDAVEAENRRLREENRRLKLEREILKKATAFFASDER